MPVHTCVIFRELDLRIAPVRHSVSSMYLGYVCEGKVFWFFFFRNARNVGVIMWSLISYSLNLITNWEEQWACHFLWGHCIGFYKKDRRITYLMEGKWRAAGALEVNALSWSVSMLRQFQGEDLSETRGFHLLLALSWGLHWGLWHCLEQLDNRKESST